MLCCDLLDYLGQEEKNTFARDKRTLFFQCCRSQDPEKYYSFTTKDWKPWLKVCWVLFKASGAVIDKNPVGMVVAADESVRDLYNMWKSKDDAPFE